MLRGIALLSVCALTAVALVQGLRPPVLRDYTVAVSGPLSKPVTIVALTDLHLGRLIARSMDSRLGGTCEQTAARPPPCRRGHDRR